MKQVLFVINTLGCAGAETAMIEMIRNMDPQKYEISVFVLLNQGEMIHRLPNTVKVLNNNFSDCSVLSKEGKKTLNRYIISQLFRRGSIWKKIPYICRGLGRMIREKRILPDKLLWRVMSDAAPRFQTHYDMAIAYLEGGSTYYVADHVSADVKVSFVHIDYEKAGYTPQFDGGCYEHFDRICTVSDEVKEHFLHIYPEYEKKTKVFHNMIDESRICEGAEKPGGFDDDFEGIRLLTVGRLTAQKAYEVAVDAMRLLRKQGRDVRWYILGEGEERKSLTKKIKEYGLEKDFLLLGAKENPYPYYKQCDIYVHATRFEGKSIAIQEAQTLGCAIVASDCPGNREQIMDGVDGKMCPLSAEGICNAIIALIDDRDTRIRYGKMAQKKELSEKTQLTELLNLMENESE
ncbi:MAG: glycosyltransferase [Eubacterium sp.]